MTKLSISSKAFRMVVFTCGALACACGSAIDDGDATATDNSTDTAEIRQTSGMACPSAKCGPPLGMPSFICADGSIGGNTGRCLKNAGGKCRWEIRNCPDSGNTCTKDQCGPPLGMPSFICADGSTGGNTGRCLRNASGKCRWEIRKCPS